MQEHIKRRLVELRKEQEAGVTMLADLDTKRAELQQTLLRIDGAVQVLQDLLDPGETSEDTEETDPWADAPVEDS